MGLQGSENVLCEGKIKRTSVYSVPIARLSVN